MMCIEGVWRRLVKGHLQAGVVEPLHSRLVACKKVGTGCAASCNKRAREQEIGDRRYVVKYRQRKF
jgi:hypothetical protein